MTEIELQKIEHEFKAGQEIPEEAERSEVNEGLRTQASFVMRQWDEGVREMRDRALLRTDLTAQRYEDLLTRYLRVLQRLYEALHTNYLSHKDKDRPQYFWEHQPFHELRLQDATRGIDVYKSDLLNAAAFYLSEPDVRTNKLDWIFLDAIVFTELEAWGDYVFMRRADTETNLAAIFAERSLGKYLAFVPVVWLVRSALRFVVWPVIAYYLFVNGYETWAFWILGLWGLYLVVRLLGVPSRFRARRKGSVRLRYLTELYGMLGERTISPRKLKETLDRAAAAGVALDGSVFSIVDRIVARDPTAFVPRAQVSY
jgi:hypothetical protein